MKVPEIKNLADLTIKKGLLGKRLGMGSPKNGYDLLKETDEVGWKSTIRIIKRRIRMKRRLFVTLIMVMMALVVLCLSSIDKPLAQSHGKSKSKIQNPVVRNDDGSFSPIDEVEDDGEDIQLEDTHEPFSLQAQLPNDIVYAGDNVSTGANIKIFRRDDLGKLTQLKVVPTGGKGLFDVVGVNRAPTGIFAATDIGPFEHDGNMIVNKDRTRLFVVNQGSDDLSVLNISADGLTLTPVPGSPFKTGHVPASVGLAAFDTVVVVNKNDDPGGQKAFGNQGSVMTFKMAANGSLTPVPNSTILFPTARGNEGVFPGQTTTPSQVLVVGDGKLIFVNDFFAGMIRPFIVNPDGTLKAGKAFDIRSLGIGVLPINGRNFPFTLGLMNYPGKNILYAGILFENKVGVFMYNTKNGKLKFVRTAINSGSTVCWFVVSKDGKHMWTSNQASNSASTYDLADPLTPKEIQVVNFQGCGEPSQLAVSPDEEWLHYSISAVTNKCPQTNPDTRSNMVRTFKIQPDGTLNELSAPFLMVDLPLGERVEGIATK
jgi:hypothetical protein